jgi:sigma-B regulation protein RsbU (phosphoserine phosphatase)
MASSYHSAYAGAMVGGDFFDVIALGDGLTGLVIGDVSGKGIEASVRTALARYSLRAYAYMDPTPSSVMQSLNTAVYFQTRPDQFITLFYGLLNVKDGILCFVNAGHMPALYFDHQSHRVSELQVSGLPLGVLDGATYEQHVSGFKSGDRLLLYTDGVTEARGAAGFFGMDRLTDFFRAHVTETPEDFVAHLVATLKQWSDERLRDDVAILLIEGAGGGVDKP